MITLETNKKSLTFLMDEATPISNIFTKYNIENKKNIDFYNKIYKHFVSWHGTENVNINQLKSKTSCFSKKIGAKALAIKILGSENQKTHIWVVKVEFRPYIIYLSLKGLSIETLPSISANQILEDLTLIKKKYSFNSDY